MSWRPRSSCRSSTIRWRWWSAWPAAWRWSARCSGNGDPLASQPGEIVAHADWYDYEAKYTPGGMELVDARRGWTARCSSGSARCRARGLHSRRLHRHGAASTSSWRTAHSVLVNELNTIPGFTATSVLRQAVRGLRDPVRGAARPSARAGAGAPPRGAAPTATDGGSSAPELQVGDARLAVRRQLVDPDQVVAGRCCSSSSIGMPAWASTVREARHRRPLIEARRDRARRRRVDPRLVAARVRHYVEAASRNRAARVHVEAHAGLVAAGRRCRSRSSRRWRGLPSIALGTSA